jgi:adenylylsulfate kinase-like enzyme
MPPPTGAPTGTGRAANVPGIHAEYEPPLQPDLVVRGDTEKPEDAARRIATALVEKGWL